MATFLTPETATTIIQTLQPIRDLTKNWDIDIAGCLDEYLLDLELSVETRQQLSTTKFAEAALVLHNSSGVYSRKVDYLHSYAYRVQRDLAHTASTTTTSHNGHSSKRGSHNVGIDKEVERFLNYDPDQDFLLLDDVLPSQPEDKVNLKEDQAGDRRSSVSILDASFANNDESRTSNTTTNTRRLSVSSLRTTVTDSNVLRLGSILNNTEGLRLSLGKCDVDDDGLCWLPGSQGSSQPFLQQQRLRSTLSNDASYLDAADSSGMVEPNDNHEDGGFVPMDDGIDNHDYDDDNNDGVGFAMAAKSPTPDTKRRVTFARDVVVPLTKMPATTMAVVDVEPEDPWKLLDPHVPEPTKRPRPLRMGKTLQLPPCLTRLPSQQQQQQGRNSKNSKDPIPDYLTHIALEPSTAADRANDSKSWTTGKRCREELPLRGLAYGNEFAYIAKELARRRKLRERQNKNGHHKGNMINHGNNTGVVEADAPLLDYFDNLNRFDDGDDNDHDDDDNGGGDDDDGGFPDFDAVADNGGPLETNTGIASVDDLYGNYNKNAEGDEGKQEKAPSFEELCREHIRRFAKGAERYAVQTKLSERVDQWQNKLRPLLDAEEQRPEFDIHQYGQALIHDMQESVAATNAKAVNFADVTKHCSRYEVCRRFLASLSLVNSGNIRLVDNNDPSPDVVQFELVSSTIERPMETFLAPSVREHGADDNDGADGDDEME